MAGGLSLPRPAVRRRRWRLVVLTLGLLAVLVAVLTGLAITVAGPFLVVKDGPEPADVIVVTYGVLGKRGLKQAAGLFDAGLAPRIVLSRFRQHPDLLTPEPVVYAQRFLVELGVPAAAAAAVPSPVTSLVEEARQLARLAAQHEWRRLLVLAMDYRSRRTQGALAKALRGTAAQSIVVPVPEPQWNPAAWWRTRQGIDHVWNEYPRLAYYRLRGNI
ncbi:MAG: hypothetical protein CL878_15765 [Dehalococcoidia bacterium]|nr:hypothetical protein [Dehalococcoidia bacterium]